MHFHQDPPQLANSFLSDTPLRAWLRRGLPEDVHAGLVPGLEALGERAVGEMLELMAQAEAEPPVHVPFDPWGRRVDEIRVSAAWRRLHAIAAEEAVIGTGYVREHGPLARLHQFARLYLYHPSSAIYSCPLAMTDGAARLIELHGDAGSRERLLPRLLSTDPENFWTSGQWMTERSGGSDVSGTSTIARRDRDGGFRLHGDKWFTSATTSEVAMTLARVEEGAGTDDRLSLFCLETRDEAGRLRGIRIHRLKDKLGTRALPTAELSLEGTPAVMLGERGRGVATIATMLNITRLYNACCAVANMGRGLALATDYAHRREAFGRPIAEQPLHRRSLARLALEHRGGLALVMHLAELLGREECGEADETERLLLRLLVPVAKLYTGRQAVAVASEVLEAFGGAGYVEDTGLPVLLRDSQVLTIWEGTTNVLSLDVLRVLAGSGDAALSALAADLRTRTAGTPVAEVVEARMHVLMERYGEDARSPEVLEAGARDLAMAIAEVSIAALLAEHAAWAREDGRDPAAEIAARRWSARLERGYPSAGEEVGEDGILSGLMS